MLKIADTHVRSKDGYEAVDSWRTASASETWSNEQLKAHLSERHSSPFGRQKLTFYLLEVIVLIVSGLQKGYFRVRIRPVSHNSFCAHRPMTTAETMATAASIQVMFQIMAQAMPAMAPNFVSTSASKWR